MTNKKDFARVTDNKSWKTFLESMTTILNMTEEQLVKDFEVRDFQSREGLGDIPGLNGDVDGDVYRLTSRTARVKLIHPKLAHKFIGLLFPSFEGVFMVTNLYFKV